MTVSAMRPDPVRVRDTAEGQHVQVIGRLDVHTAADARLVLHEAVDTGVGDLLLDLGHAEIGDSTGLGLLVECHRRSRRLGRPVRLVAASERSRRILRRARLDRAFGLTGTTATVVTLTA
jgi:anti-anti-sigma factor